MRQTAAKLHAAVKPTVQWPNFRYTLSRSGIPSGAFIEESNMGDFYPWGPHGPRSDHPNIIPNPTAPDPAPKFESFQPTLPSFDSSSSAYSGSSYSPALPRNPGKGVLMGILLTALFGPLGLFYASKKGALAMLATWSGLSMLMSLPGVSPAAQPGAPLPALWIEVAFQLAWPLAALGSIVWSVIAVIAHNKRLAG